MWNPHLLWPIEEPNALSVFTYCPRLGRHVTDRKIASITKHDGEGHKKVYWVEWQADEHASTIEYACLVAALFPNAVDEYERARRKTPAEQNMRIARAALSRLNQMERENRIRDGSPPRLPRSVVRRLRDLATHHYD